MEGRVEVWGLCVLHGGEGASRGGLACLRGGGLLRLKLRPADGRANRGSNRG
eukprot:COSAG02_NODE_1253_length_13598_cov_3.599526_1_plen_52_part_00